MMHNSVVHKGTSIICLISVFIQDMPCRPQASREPQSIRHYWVLSDHRALAPAANSDIFQRLAVWALAEVSVPDSCTDKSIRVDLKAHQCHSIPSSYWGVLALPICLELCWMNKNRRHAAMYLQNCFPEGFLRLADFMKSPCPSKHYGMNSTIMLRWTGEPSWWPVLSDDQYMQRVC